ncbi:MAG: hypothetical protein Q9162_004214 [Coniocarpon cinnabarinum]
MSDLSPSQSHTRDDPRSSHTHHNEPPSQDHSHHRHRRHHHNDRNREDRPHKRRKLSPPRKAATLPYEAPYLSKRDLPSFKGLFTSYLDIQKQKDIHDLDEEEVKGRWKSFYHKWNHGELASGWYDPDLKSRVDAQMNAQSQQRNEDRNESDAQSDEDATGPKPAPKTFADLADDDEARVEAQQAHRNSIRAARTLDRKQQKERLDDLAPKAEPGTRERQLEKKREASDAAAAYRAGREGGGMEEVGERDLMGNEGGLEEVKRARMQEQRKKTEREQRREEIYAAKRAEKEERIKGAREKEERTMDMFRTLARERFGPGAG